MARGLIAIVASLLLILGSAIPATHAAGHGGGHGGGGHAWHGGGSWGHGGGGHWGGRAHHGWWGGAFLGGVALGTALAYPWTYPYPATAYGYPYPSYYAYPSYYPYPTYAATAPAVVYQQPAVQREVVYSTGKYVLYGDGVTQPWQWVWFPAQPPAQSGPSQ